VFYSKSQARLRLSGGIKRKPRVTSIEKAFQMTSQNASLREREQVSLRSGDDGGADVIISRPLNARSSEHASHRIMLLQWSWGAANLRSFPRGHMSSRSIRPSFLPSFLYLYAASDNGRRRYPSLIYLDEGSRSAEVHLAQQSGEN